MFYDWWVLNRKHQSCDIIYSTYRRFDNETKYMLRNSKRDNLMREYDGATSSREKWNIIHWYGVTRKSRKVVALNLGEQFGLDKLNEQFTSLQPLAKRRLNVQTLETGFQFKQIDGGLVRKVIHAIISNSTGPDGLPPKLYKLMSQYISQPISDIINCSFTSGVYPSALKHISITPIPKVEEPVHTSQFRPISSANFLSKIISKITCGQMNEYLEGNGILTEHQSGFRHKHSCTTAILRLTEDLHKSIAGGKCLILVLLDFANAFGSVDHDTLIQILRSVGVMNMTLEWFKGFFIWLATIG